MSKKKKILLGEKDVITKKNEDIYLDIELSRSINEIKSDRFDNDFYLDEQFNKERNDTFRFCVYGQVD